MRIKRTKSSTVKKIARLSLLGSIHFSSVSESLFSKFFDANPE